jgi:hypothetical protein
MDCDQMFTKKLTQAGHVRRFSIQEAGGHGWEVREEQDSHVIRHVRYDDWHRVERALNSMRAQVDELEESGWRVMA